jgi:predicted histone-like DNA-binding protein
MPVILKKKQCRNARSTGYGKWYPKVVNLGTIDTDELCEHIQSHGSIYTADVVTGVVKKFTQCIQELLLESHKVKLNGIGTFYLRAKGEGKIKAEDLNYADTDFVLGFTPERSHDSKYVGPVLTRRAMRMGIEQLEQQGEAKPSNTTNGGGYENNNSGGDGNNSGGDGNTNTDPVEERP